MNRVPYVTDVQVQPHGSLYIMKRTLTRIRYKGVPPGSLYTMSRVTHVSIYRGMAPGMYTKYSPICNRYTGIAPDSLHRNVCISPDIIDITGVSLVHYI